MTDGHTCDVVVVGAGIVGAAIAERLAREGRSVTLLDRGTIGAEASWAAAGLLTPIHPWNYPAEMLALDDESFAMWPAVVGRLREDTGVDLELRRTGLLSVSESEEDEREADRRVAWRRERGESIERLAPEDALREEPALSPDLRGALYSPDLAQIRCHRAAPAMALAAERHGAIVREHTPVLGVEEHGDRVVGVRTPDGVVRCETVVACAGAWTAGLLPGFPRVTIPARGQIVLLRATPGALRHMILSGGDYLVPRADGRVLAGST